MPGNGGVGTAVAAVAAGFGAIAIVGFWMLVLVTMLLFFLYLGRRAWRIDQEYRILARRANPVEPPPLRRWISRLAWAMAIYYVAVLIGNAGFNLYTSGSTLASMPSTYAVIKTPTGVTKTGNPQEWNNHAWKLATDSDPSHRDPAQALKLAEQAVTAEPQNTSFANTLGIARYRTGDFAGAIQTLSIPDNVREFVSHNGFFLAMAHARLGHHDDAAQWYTRANDWMNQHDSGNDELQRFREEAAAVLSVVKDKSEVAAQPRSSPATAK
jgi:tetratricopeptide (TPR) repeat protein